MPRYYYRHRTLCDVLSDMRMCCETSNYSQIKGLIEEAQILGNKMEAGLSYQKDIEELHEKRKELIQKVKLLEAKLPEKDKSIGDDKCLL